MGVFWGYYVLALNKPAKERKKLATNSHNLGKLGVNFKIKEKLKRHYNKLEFFQHIHIHSN